MFQRVKEESWVRREKDRLAAHIHGNSFCGHDCVDGLSILAEHSFRAGQSAFSFDPIEISRRLHKGH